jgi:hypothetical protein
VPLLLSYWVELRLKLGLAQRLLAQEREQQQAEGSSAAQQQQQRQRGAEQLPGVEPLLLPLLLGVQVAAGLLLVHGLASVLAAVLPVPL